MNLHHSLIVYAGTSSSLICCMTVIVIKNAPTVLPLIHFVFQKIRQKKDHLFEKAVFQHCHLQFNYLW